MLEFKKTFDVVGDRLGATVHVRFLGTLKPEGKGLKAVEAAIAEWKRNVAEQLKVVSAESGQVVTNDYDGGDDEAWFSHYSDHIALQFNCTGIEFATLRSAQRFVRALEADHSYVKW